MLLFVTLVLDGISSAKAEESNSRVSARGVFSDVKTDILMRSVI